MTEPIILGIFSSITYWLFVYLINNNGVCKKLAEAAVFDMKDKNE